MKRLLLAALLVPGAASASIIDVEYWGTIAHDFTNGNAAGNPIHGRFEIDTSLAPHGNSQPGQTFYENHGDSPLFIDRSAFITDPDSPSCGCSLDSLLLSDAIGPSDTDVFNVKNYERYSDGSFTLQELEFQSNDLLHGTSLSQTFDFDQAPTTFGRLIVNKVVNGVGVAFSALLDRVKALTRDAPGTCRA